MTGDGYLPYVVAAYAATLLIIGALVWQTLAANARTRARLAALERERGR